MKNSHLLSIPFRYLISVWTWWSKQASLFDLNPMAVLSSAIISEPVTDWATLLCKSLLFNNGSLDFHPPEVLGSIKVVNILADDVSSTTNKWNCALIAQILGSDSTLDAVKKFAETKWNDFGLLEVHKLDNGLFVFRFQSEESKIKVLEEPLVSYGSKMMFLSSWVPNKPIQKLTLRTVPIWIKLPGLGLQYFSLQALSKLGSLVGRPLFLDKVTADQSRLAYARMCVEIKADEELPNEIIFLNEFGVEILQKMEYEWIPPRCTSCKIFGHNTNICTRNSSPELKAKGDADSHDMKSEQPGINADSEKVDQKASCNDGGESQEKSLLLEEKACPCGSKKLYNACCGSVSGRSSCKDEGGSEEKKGLLPEEKACSCGSKKNYNACCGSVSGRSICKDDGGSEEKKGLLPEEKKFSRNKPFPCGSKKRYKAGCESVSGRSSCEDGRGSQEKKSLLYEDKVKVNGLTPETHGHTLTIKVVSSNSVITSAGSLSTRPRPRVAECLVGDETGTIIFTARNEQVDLMKANATVILRKAKINMFKGFMRLAVDKWGCVEVTEPADFAVKEDNNLSLVEYELEDAAEQ